MDRHRKESRMIVQFASKQVEDTLHGNSPHEDSLQLAEEKAKLQQELLRSLRVNKKCSYCDFNKVSPTS